MRGGRNLEPHPSQFLSVREAGTWVNLSTRGTATEGTIRPYCGLPRFKWQSENSSHIIAIFRRLRFLSIPSQTHDLAWDCSIMKSMGVKSRDRSMPKTATRNLIAFFAGYLKRRNPLISTLILFLVLLQVLPARAWVFPEHRDIAVQAEQGLDADRQVQLQALWTEARSGHEGRLCAQIADPAQVQGPACIDFAAMTAISGDHSCSAHEMLDTSLNAAWVLGVAQVAGRLKEHLTAAAHRSQRDNAVRNSDLALERTDPEYVTRATSNNAHFLLARPNVDLDAESYVRLALKPEAEINALGTYVWYHLRALDRASSIAHGAVPAAAHADAVRAALADEAFALHFLEDSFAAGHVAGNWGGSAMRKGTHDFYNERGLALTTWNGEHFVGQGDAFMKPADATRAANAVGDSLAQLVDAFAGKAELTSPDDPKYVEAESFNVCKGAQFPTAAGKRKDIVLVVPILRQTPVPGLGRGPGEMPRFRTEMGPFVGLSTGFRGALLTHGFGPGETGVSASSGIELAGRVGLGMDGIVDESSDGLVFVEGGYREDSGVSGAYTVPGRGAITARLRMPFFLVPGDVLVAAPVLAFLSPDHLQNMVVKAVNGGLIPWQAGIATRAGRLQIVLGREVGVSIFRDGGEHTFLLPSPGVPAANTPCEPQLAASGVSGFRVSPVPNFFCQPELEPDVVQPYVGFEIPTAVSVISPANARIPDAHTIVTTGVRVVFDWRHYFN